MFDLVMSSLSAGIAQKFDGFVLIRPKSAGRWRSLCRIMLLPERQVSDLAFPFVRTTPFRQQENVITAARIQASQLTSNTPGIASPLMTRWQAWAVIVDTS